MLLKHKIDNEPKNDDCLYNLNSPYKGFNYKESQILNSIKSFKEIKFENGDVFQLPPPKNYSEWLDKPETIVLEYVNFISIGFNFKKLLKSILENN